MQIIVLFNVHSGMDLVDKKIEKDRAIKNSMASHHLGTFCKG